MRSWSEGRRVGDEGCGPLLPRVRRSAHYEATTPPSITSSAPVTRRLIGCEVHAPHRDVVGCTKSAEWVAFIRSLARALLTCADAVIGVSTKPG